MIRVFASGKTSMTPNDELVFYSLEMVEAGGLQAEESKMIQ